jgi:membrane peptidoglycan carboxypeptidase
MGIRSFSPEREYGLSLTLGGGEVTPLELTGAFATLAGGGVLTQPNPILAASDALGKDVTPARPYLPQAVSAATAFQVSDILSDNTARKPMFGENSPLKLSRPAAAKTGTTTDFRDNWTVGFTKYLVTGVWAGNANGQPMKGTTGLTGAAPIWHDFNEAVIANPEILAELGAPNDPANPSAGWEFTPPADVEQRPDCPPALTCREGGEYFSKSWLEAAGEAGPLADTVENAPSAPVYADRGGWVWSAYCRVEPAVVRTMLKLPGLLGLPGQVDQAAMDNDTKTAQMRAMAWSLSHPLPVNVGPCDGLPRVAAQAGAGRVSADLGAAMNPNVGTAPVGGQVTATSAYTGGAAAGATSYALAQPVTHHNSCPGNYIMGQVIDWQGRSVAGVQVRMVDQWGNIAETASKDGAGDFGLFDFPLNYFANQYTLTVLDGNGRAISAPVVVDHLQGAGGDAPCHTVVLRGG